MKKYLAFVFPYIALIAAFVAVMFYVNKDVQATMVPGKTGPAIFNNGLSTGAATVQDMDFGNWVGTFSNASNFNSPVFAGGTYHRVGPMVTIGWRMTADVACAGAAFCVVDISLPIASGFTQLHDLTGGCYMTGASGNNKSGAAFAKTGDDEIGIQITDITLTSTSWYCNAHYQVK